MMNDLRKRFPIYSILLNLYPKSYRAHFGEQILQTMADMLDNSPSNLARLAIWFHAVAELPINVAKQQAGLIGGIYIKETPSYLKINSLISGLLLIPFIAALIANSLDKVLNNHTLYGSWLWHRPTISLWVLYLPIAALLLVIGSYIYYVHKYKKTALLRRLFDIKLFWPIFIPGVLAFAILFIAMFHDSIHCWVQTPLHLASHISQTWQCSETNRAF